MALPVVADAELSSANSSPHGHSIQRTVLVGQDGLGHRIYGFIRVGSSGRDLKLPYATWIEQPCRTLVCGVSLLSLRVALFFLEEFLFCRLRPALAHAAANARHSVYVFRLVSMCHMMVASFLITATRAMDAPLLRFIRLYHSRSFASFRNAW